MKLAIIDLDDVVADPLARRDKAESARSAILANDPEAKKEADSAFFKALFEPDGVATDVLITGAISRIEAISEAGYQICYMSSRPESMREATVAWMREHGLEIASAETHIPGVDWLILCAPAFRNGFTKTIVWKAGIIETLAQLFGVENLLFVDDTEKNLEAVRNATFSDCEVNVYASLDAVQL